MNEEILDNEFGNNTESNQFKFVNYISILILWFGIGYCGISGLLSELKVILAISLLLISTAATYFNYELGTKITFATILIGTLNLVDFFPIKSFIGFEINSISVGVEFILFAIGIIHYFTNKNELSRFLKNIFNPEISEEEIKSAQRTKINRFKRRFSGKKLNELERIIKNEKLLPEALKAAEELINEKLENRS